MSSPPPSRGRTTDLGLLVVGALIIFTIAIGGVAAFLFTTRGDSQTCQLQSVGSVSDRIDQVKLSPVFVTGGKGCAYWLDRVGDRLVAYKALPTGETCPLDWKGRRNTYVFCNRPVRTSSLARYPTWDVLQTGLEVTLVDLRPQTCARYELGVAARIRERLDSDGAARIEVPESATFWIALNKGGQVEAVASDKAKCSVGRSKAGDLTCDDALIDPDRLPQHPIRTTRDGSLVVDTTQII